jgi:hypothetical protein
MILLLAKRTARRLWCIRLFATFSVQPCTDWKLGCGIVDLTTKDTKHTKLSEQEAFEAILQFRPEVSVNRDRTTAHSIRQNVEFHLRVLRGCSNGVRWSTPEWRTFSGTAKRRQRDGTVNGKAGKSRSPDAANSQAGIWFLRSSAVDGEPKERRR